MGFYGNDYTSGFWPVDGDIPILLIKKPGCLFWALTFFYFHSLLLWTLRLWSRDPKGVPKLCLKTIDLLLPFSLKNPSFYERAAKQGQLATNRSGPKIWFILLFVFEFYIKKPVFMNIWGNFFLCMGKLCPLPHHP